eukprot:scaffold73673_cov20-Tisochrysis_lutea.AAC.1
MQAANFGMISGVQRNQAPIELAFCAGGRGSIEAEQPHSCHADRWTLRQRTANFLVAIWKAVRCAGQLGLTARGDMKNSCFVCAIDNLAFRAIWALLRVIWGQMVISWMRGNAWVQVRNDKMSEESSGCKAGLIDVWVDSV